MRRRIAFVLLIILTVSLTTLVYAQEREGHKLERGVIQLGASIIDIPKAIYRESKATNPVVGLPVGLLKGLGNAFAHIFSGIFNIITCPFPEPEMNAEMFPDVAASQTNVPNEVVK